MGNKTVEAAGSSGWFGNITSNLGQLASGVAPLVSALNTGGTKAPVTNSSRNAGVAAETGSGFLAGMTTQTKLLIAGVALLLLGGAAFLLMRGKKG